MPLDFPSSPAINDPYTFGDRTWIWNGTAWITQSFGGIVGPTGPQGATGANGSATIPIASTGSTGVASFDGEQFNVSTTGHVVIRTGIKAGNLIVLGQSTIFGAGGTGALPALDGSALTGVDAKYLQGKTPRQITDGGTF